MSVDVVESEAERFEMIGGLDTPVGDDMLLSISIGVACFITRLAHDANEAKCKGKHPCRDSRTPAASGYN